MAAPPSILLCSTAWKGTLSALQVNTSLRQGLSTPFTTTARLFTMADGGDGWLDAMAETLGDTAQTQWLVVCGPLPNQPIQAPYLWAAQTQTAYLESAHIHGLKHLSDGEKAPLLATSFGVGEALQAIYQQHPDIQHLVVSVGGSASSDGGLGALQALGWQFLSPNHTALLDPIGGQDLFHIESMTPAPALNIPHVSILVDVETTYVNAPRVFSPQKGATPVDVIRLTHGFLNVLRHVGQSNPVLQMPGSGAAGGLAGALKLAFANSTLENGFRWTAQACGLAAALERAEWVISGEGRVDETTLLGKGTGQLMTWAETHQTPLLLVCGTCTLHESPNPWVRIAPIFGAQHRFTAEELAQTPEYITQTVRAALPTIGQTHAWPEDDSWAIVCEPTVTAAHPRPVSLPRTPQ